MIAAALRHYWYPVALSAEVGDRPFAARLLDEELVLYRWQAEAGRITENFMDSSHFAWVHEGILGDRANPVDPPLDVLVDEVGLRYAIPNPLTGTERVYRVTLPYTLHLAREPRASEATGRRVLLFTCCPRSETETRHFCLVARDFDLDGDDAAFSALNDRVMAQDQAICERQRPPALPLHLADELHVRGPDTQSVAYRRALARLFGVMLSTPETEQMLTELSWAEPVKVRVERE